MTYTIVIIIPNQVAVAYDEHNRVAGKVFISSDGKSYDVESDDDDLPVQEMLDKLEFEK